MNLNTLLKALAPKNNQFFSLFDQMAANLQVGADVLVELLESPDASRRIPLIKQLEDIEHRGDELTHEVILALNQSFITPFDREDIHTLATSLDDVLDFIHASARSIESYRLGEITPEIKQLGKLIQQASAELNKAIPLMANMKNADTILAACIKINSLENDADNVLDYATAELFSTQTDAIQIIKIKDVVQLLENATDKAEDAANVLETILLKAS